MSLAGTDTRANAFVHTYPRCVAWAVLPRPVKSCMICKLRHRHRRGPRSVQDYTRAGMDICPLSMNAGAAGSGTLSMASSRTLLQPQRQRLGGNEAPQGRPPPHNNKCVAKHKATPEGTHTSAQLLRAAHQKRGRLVGLVGMHKGRRGPREHTRCCIRR